MPSFDKMTLERHGHEGCTTADPASSSSRPEPVKYAFAEHDRAPEGRTHEEEWDDLVYVEDD